MAVLIVTDNYFYMQGLVNMADDECGISWVDSYDSEFAQQKSHALSSEDYVIIHFAQIDKILCAYRYYLSHTQAKVIVAPDAKFVSEVSDINNICFLSANASVKTVESILKLKKIKVRKRNLTVREEKIMSLMIIGNLLNDVSEILGLSIKTVSLHKNNTSNKVGLLNNNNITMLGLMRFILPASGNAIRLI
ncbi:DNA-binding NarL/FixJ family response regulator [Raoultella sp. BIGb0138]|uniref:LuxR C-terminal-related transcriptional regulator n=1 Tax=Raoultella sp. BIGb0138 TaxID=2485115 RepID=UPI00104799B8|nr:LuxR C-terminal-related transcriptional regulator [Raoultella sp. BIGb0138]TCW12424.1 DNA-binding NarL/FixJ family response regulator [Raoultella sp. BIGb0138]